MKTYDVSLSADEMEYVMMGLHCFIEKNAEHAQNPELRTISSDTKDLNLVDEMWAPQHVEVSRLLDKLVEVTGYDLAVDGQ